jgi:hypothetical protein
MEAIDPTVMQTYKRAAVATCHDLHTRMTGNVNTSLPSILNLYGDEGFIFNEEKFLCEEIVPSRSAPKFPHSVFECEHECLRPRRIKIESAECLLSIRS